MVTVRTERHHRLPMCNQALVPKLNACNDREVGSLVHALVHVVELLNAAFAVEVK